MSKPDLNILTGLTPPPSPSNPIAFLTCPNHVTCGGGNGNGKKTRSFRSNADVEAEGDETIGNSCVGGEDDLRRPRPAPSGTREARSSSG